MRCRYKNGQDGGEMTVNNTRGRKKLPHMSERCNVSERE